MAAFMSEQKSADRSGDLVRFVLTGSEVGVDVGGCSRYASDSQVRLQDAADRAGSKHIGGSPTRGKAGPQTGSPTRPGSRPGESVAQLATSR